LDNAAGMSNYHRVRVSGGTYFFTVNLLERHRRLLVEHIDERDKVRTQNLALNIGCRPGAPFS